MTAAGGRAGEGLSKASSYRGVYWICVHPRASAVDMQTAAVPETFLLMVSCPSWQGLFCPLMLRRRLFLRYRIQIQALRFGVEGSKIARQGLLQLVCLHLQFGDQILEDRLGVAYGLAVAMTDHREQ